MTSSCPLFAAGVVMTPLLTSLQQQNAHGNRWQIHALWGSAPQYPMVPYASSTKPSHGIIRESYQTDSVQAMTKRGKLTISAEQGEKVLADYQGK